jgi:hypothetical protein
MHIFILCSYLFFLSVMYSRNSALNVWRSNIRCDTFTLAPRWRGSLRDRVNVVEYIGTMVLNVWSTNALLQLTSLMTDVNSLCKSSVGWAQSSCWHTVWMNHVPETSQQRINQLATLGETKGLSLASFQLDQSPIRCVGLPRGITIFPYRSTVQLIPHHST